MALRTKKPLMMLRITFHIGLSGQLWTQRGLKTKMNKTKIARHVACVQALKGGSPNSPFPFLCLPHRLRGTPWVGAALIIMAKCTSLHYGARQTMGSWDENGDTLDFSAIPFHTTYRIVCCIANTLQQMNRDKKTCRFPGLRRLFSYRKSMYATPG